jgi:hypothetical protein
VTTRNLLVLGCLLVAIPAAAQTSNQPPLIEDNGRDVFGLSPGLVVLQVQFTSECTKPANATAAFKTSMRPEIFGVVVPPKGTAVVSYEGFTVRGKLTEAYSADLSATIDSGTTIVEEPPGVCRAVTVTCEATPAIVTWILEVADRPGLGTGGGRLLHRATLAEVTRAPRVDCPKPPTDPRGLVKKPWVYVAGGVAATAPLWIGGGDSPAPPATGAQPQQPVAPPVSNTPVAPVPPVAAPSPAPAPAPQPQPPIAVVPESGPFDVTGCQVGPDPFSEESVIGLCRLRQIIVSASGGGASISGAPLPPGVGGTLSGDASFSVTGRINTVGNGTPASWDVSVRFPTAKSMSVAASVTVNVNGSSRSIPYSLTAVKP